jgi:hypothetical protein
LLIKECLVLLIQPFDLGNRMKFVTIAINGITIPKMETAKAPNNSKTKPDIGAANATPATDNA